MYRKYDAKLKSHVLTIFAGEFYVSIKNEVISTVLGSCISVCLYDSVKHIYGINHFMLPKSTSQSPDSPSGSIMLKDDGLTENSMRYGITAMEILISEMQKSGADRKNFKAKIFGGGRVLSGQSASSAGKPGIGDKNIGFTRAFLKMEKIEIVSENVGDMFGRKIYFVTGKNSVFVKKVAIEPALEAEQDYMKKLTMMKEKADITLF